MKTVTVLLPDIIAVKKFVYIANECGFDLDLASGRYQVNAKSIMGIFSLDLSAPMTLHLHTDDEEAAQRLLEQVEPYLVK